MKIVASIFSLLTVMSMYAQERPVISSAIIAIRDNDVATAKKYIDEADQIISSKPKSEIKSKDLTKFYYYKGAINMAVYSSDALRAKYPDALKDAYDGYKSSIKFEQEVDRNDFIDKSREDIINVANAYANKAIQASNEGENKKAYELFMRVYNLKKENANQMDTAMLNNASLMAINAGMLEEAKKLTKQLVDMNYKGVNYRATNVETGQEQAFRSKEQMNTFVETGKYKEPRVFGDVRPELYVSLAQLNLRMGDTARYQEIVTEGRKIYPQNEKLLRAELDIFLKSGNYEKALTNLDQAIAMEPENVKMFHYIKGNILQTQMKEIERAKEAYSKALALDSNYLDPLYMQGLIYVNKGNATTLEMNDLPLDAKSKYEKLKKRQQEEFSKALPYFEKAYKIDPNDQDNLTALAEVYQKLGRYKDAQRIKSEISQ